MTIYFKMPFLLSKHTVEFNTLLMSKDFRVVISRHIIVTSRSIQDCNFLITLVQNEAIIWIFSDLDALLNFITVWLLNRL